MTAPLEVTTRPETTVARRLQDTLVELIDLSLQAKQAHWNVVGPGFRPVHAFLDELAVQFRDWYDDVAERLVALEVAPDGRAPTVSATTPLDQLPAGPLAERTVLESFNERLTLVAARVRERATAIGDTDLASQDLLIGVLRGLDKQRWMVRAHLG